MEIDKFYHLYNRANGKDLLFKSDENYNYFLRQFTKYIAPTVKVFAYCLLPNHFHFVVQIKSEEELNPFFKEKLSKGSKNLESLISLQFGHFFNSYTKAFNKMYQRHGSLFSPNYKRKEINTDSYLREVIQYVHLNPIHHKFSSNFENYKYSSYRIILSKKDTLLCRRELIELFDDIDNLKYVHTHKKLSIKLLEQILEEDN